MESFLCVGMKGAALLGFKYMVFFYTHPVFFNNLLHVSVCMRGRGGGFLIMLYTYDLFDV